MSNSIESVENHLDGAKSRLRAAARSIQPLAPLREHPYTTVAVAGIAGFLIGSKDHPAIMKTVRLSMAVGNLLKPAVMLAGKYAATHMAKKAVDHVADANAAADGTVETPQAV